MDLSIDATPEEIDKIERTSREIDGQLVVSFIDFKAFRNFVKDRLPKAEENIKGLVEAFKVFNRSGNGMVTAKEVRHVLQSLGHELTEDEALEAFYLGFDKSFIGGFSTSWLEKLRAKHSVKVSAR